MKKPFLFLSLLVIPAWGFRSTDINKANKAAITSCETKILSYTGWKETPKTKWNLEIKTRNSGQLTYFGAEHSDKPEHSQFKKIKAEFLKTQPTLVFFEGPNRGIATSETETIKQFGESGYVRFLANNANVKVQSLEPNPQDEIRYLMETGNYSAEQVKLFFVLRETARLRDRKNVTGQALKTSISQLLQKANAMFPEFKTVITDTTELQTAYAKYWTAPQNWTQAPSAWFDPKGNAEQTGGKFTHDINRLSSEFRNVHMYRILSEAVQNGEKVFAVVGRNHVPMQAEALKCSLKGL
ncbi:hypothetical protein [Adhaeribacter terreus]|uniref:TraB/GumN family protein n=1 Tax=Adhaeribacter terreus TaxID=529703 RepID=A0ABW0EC37_9BACT